MAVHSGIHGRTVRLIKGHSDLKGLLRIRVIAGQRFLQQQAAIGVMRIDGIRILRVPGLNGSGGAVELLQLITFGIHLGNGIGCSVRKSVDPKLFQMLQLHGSGSVFECDGFIGGRMIRGCPDGAEGLRYVFSLRVLQDNRKGEFLCFLRISDRIAGHLLGEFQAAGDIFVFKTDFRFRYGLIALSVFL